MNCRLPRSLFANIEREEFHMKEFDISITLYTHPRTFRIAQGLSEWGRSEVKKQLLVAFEDKQWIYFQVQGWLFKRKNYDSV